MVGKIRIYKAYIHNRSSSKIRKLTPSTFISIKNLNQILSDVS